jgi:hypothetical protein
MNPPSFTERLATVEEAQRITEADNLVSRLTTAEIQISEHCVAVESLRNDMRFIRRQIWGLYGTLLGGMISLLAVLVQFVLAHDFAAILKVGHGIH